MTHRDSVTWSEGISNTIVLPSSVETISLKLTKEQARLLAKAAKEEGFPSKSEFVRYALARALEEKLSVKTIEEIFEARRQVRRGKIIPLQRLVAED
jgi:Arc/MetJ-type ribon-helix-helix transcriptional regulator